MKIILEERVQKYIKDRYYEGILLKEKNTSFGWAGCRLIIQGEFIKDYSVIIEKKFSHKQIKVDGIKVLIPYELKLDNTKEIRISEIFSTFSKEMSLCVELSEI